MWVGPKPLTPLAKRCIASWEKHLPDYEIKLWNETNSPMDHTYVQAMYQQGKWAFVSDYIRFWALEQEGGIYLDTDMELLKPLDAFLDTSGFVGRSKNGHIESSIIGVVPHSLFSQAALAFYDNDTSFDMSDTSPRVISKIINDNPACDIQVYEASYFHPCDEGETLSAEAKEKAYAVHHWAESWVQYAVMRKIARRLGLMRIIKLFVRS